ncbi:MAG: PIN domain-containing protein [Caldilineaceae bacterium]|nr:PIN domain-containing protein [Caldilineaceae bacterium]HRJ42992.1 PIN domain-containing protein [Caldilineaceae bacterium]
MSSDIPENSYVTDTMAVVLHLEQRRSSQRVKTVFNEALRAEAKIYVPAIVFAEILYLTAKHRISASLADVQRLLRENPTIEETPLSLAVVSAASEITDIPELHDRLIAGSARLLRFPLLTNDPKIQASRFIQTIW